MDPRVNWISLMAMVGLVSIAACSQRTITTGGSHSVSSTVPSKAMCPHCDNATNEAALTTPQNETVAERKISFVTDWIPIEKRRPLQNLDVAYTDQDANSGKLSELVNEPALITFFYSRCQNSRKCSAAVSRLATLQKRLHDAGIEEQVRLIAITYEPQYDSPERIKRFGLDRGLQFGEHTKALQLEQKRQKQFVTELEAPVSYNAAAWVSTHGVELTLIDSQGSVVRKYHTLLWDNDQVLQDVQRLLKDEHFHSAGHNDRNPKI